MYYPYSKVTITITEFILLPEKKIFFHKKEHGLVEMNVSSKFI